MTLVPNVLFVDQTGQLGGAELCLREIVLHRNHCGDHVALLADGPFADRLRDDNVDVSVHPFSPRSTAIQKGTGLFEKLASSADVMRVASRLRSLSTSYDVVYANTAKALVVASLACMLIRKPLIFHLHDILSMEHFSTSNRRLLVKLANRAGGVIANSQATADAYFDSGGRRDHVTVIANGIDFDPFDKAMADADAHRLRIRQSMNVERQTLVGLIGRLSPWKGQHVAIEAIAELPNTHLALVGDALFGETEYANQLRDLVRRMGLEHRVHFLGFRSDIPEIMQACDLILHASVAAEPFGRVIPEAMVSKRPVVVADAGGAAAIVSEGETGWLYRSGDFIEMRGAMHRAIDQADSAILEEAAHLARSRYSQSDRADDVSRLILGVRKFNRVSI